MRKVLYILGQLSDEDMEWLISAGEAHTLRQGVVLVREGEPIDAFYIVLDGELSISTTGTGEAEIARLSAGEIIGEISFVDARPPAATVTAVRDSAVFGLDRRRLQARLAQDPSFAARFYRAVAIFLADRLRSTVGRLGYGVVREADRVEAVQAEDELDVAVLDNVHLAGARFGRLLKRMMGG